MQRRDVLKTGLALGGAGLLATRGTAQDNFLKYLCPPDGTPPDLLFRPSPPSRPFAAPLNILPVKDPVPVLNPPPDPAAHQRWNDFLPKKFYTIYEQEFRWVYHPDPPYDAGSWSWGFDGITPGPTYHARYGEPVLVRRFNNLPPVSRSKVTFALPSTSSHLHNGHTASESDGIPQDWIDSGEFWDHHYACYPSGGANDEKLTTLWYHDHRLDFTAANVYAGLAGFSCSLTNRTPATRTTPTLLRGGCPAVSTMFPCCSTTSSSISPAKWSSTRSTLMESWATSTPSTARSNPTSGWSAANIASGF